MELCEKSLSTVLKLRKPCHWSPESVRPTRQINSDRAKVLSETKYILDKLTVEGVDQDIVVPVL